MATTISKITVDSAAKLVDSTSHTMPSAGTTNASEEFEAAISAADGNWYIEISNENGNNAVSVTLVGGSYVGAGDVALGKIEAGRSAVFCADSALCRTADGKIRIKLTPTEGSALVNNDLKLRAVQFLPVETK